MGKVCHVVACCNQVISRSDSSALVYRGLFFPDSSFPPPITPSPPPPPHAALLSVFISLPLSHLPVASLSLSVSPLSLRVLTQFVPATTSYQGLLSCKSAVFPSAQIHLFYHHSFLSIYTGLGGRNCWSIWAMLCVIS